MINYILRDENAVYYECGFSCDNELYLRLGNEAYFITDPRYSLEAKEVVKNAEVIEAPRDLYSEAKKILKESRIKKIYYDPSDFTVAQFNKLKQSLKIIFKAASNFSQKKRIIKSEDEIELIKTAVKLGSDAFDSFAKSLQQDAEDRSEKYINFLALKELSHSGVYDLSFEPITAIDQNAAKPHAYASDKILKPNSLILVDAGVKYKRFCSDRTRTAEFTKDIEFKKEQSFSNKKIQKIYDIVLKAQEASIKRVKPGVKASEIDKAARDVIEKAGYAKEFVHSTGHGVGLDIHELPIISKKSSMVIEENMIFTIEPGIYLPDKFGIRIEDMVRVTANGVEIL
jgi:Xaa-Pro aminopeptidase